MPFNSTASAIRAYLNDREASRRTARAGASRCS